MTKIMTDLTEPLSEEEIEWLDAFLLDRFDEEADYRDMDEGILCISDLDGLLTAVVSGPVMVPPSVWISAIWGGVEPQWHGEEQIQQVMSLLMRHMNGIAGMLMEQPEEFEPMFQERLFEERVVTIVDEWCEGYMRGVGLAGGDWELDSEEVVELLRPITAFTEVTDWEGHNLERDAMEALQQQVGQSVRELHAYWLYRRSEGAQNAPVRHEGPKVGRNDPCPCGSGKKYKKCCLH